MSKINHYYGDNIHILDDVFLSTLLAKVGHPESQQPLINDYILEIYEALIARVVSEQFPVEVTTVDTRMKQFNPEATVTGPMVKSNTKAVSVSLARAGILPSHVCYNLLNHVLEPRLVRQDHIYASRIVNEQGHVTGTSFSGSKMGGSVDNSIVVIPDPMGATGGTLIEVLDYYKSLGGGDAQKYIALHLIITPEYISNIKEKHPDLIVYSARLDRGLSDKKALDAAPGMYPELEKGLNDNQYIVPGAGGVGEVMNNVYD